MQGRGIFGILARNTTTTQPCHCYGMTWVAGHTTRTRVGGTIIPGPTFLRRREFISRCSAGSHSYTSDRNANGGGGTAAKKSLPEELRQLLRYLVNSVVVCTAQPPTVMSEGTSVRGDAQRTVPRSPPSPVGLTMSSFTSLSLHPSPVVSFNISMPSRTEAAIVQSRHFMIHILSGDAQGARVADIFRSGNAHPAATSDELLRSSCQFVSPVSHQTGSHHQPFLRGPGILYVLRCRLLDEPLGGLIPVRDHVIVLGEVMEILPGGNTPVDDIDEPIFGLVYGGRHYRQLCGAVVKAEPRQ